MKRRAFAPALFLVLGSACSSRGGAGSDAGTDAGPSSSAAVAAPLPSPPPSSAPSPSTPSSGTYEDETSTRPVEVLKFQFTSGVNGRVPVDKMTTAVPGDRVYGYLTVRNRTGRPRQVHFEFSVNGETRTVKDLDVSESWSYRTWAYNTISRKDKPGKLTLVVTDDEGHPLVEESLPILKK